MIDFQLFPNEQLLVDYQDLNVIATRQSNMIPTLMSNIRVGFACIKKIDPTPLSPKPLHADTETVIHN